MFKQVSTGRVPQPLPRQSSLAQASGDLNSSAQPSTGGAVTFIGRALVIVGDQVEISSQTSLLIEGKVVGTVRAAHVVVGEGGFVEGTVAGERVEIVGCVVGAIAGRDVTLRSSANVRADIHHETLMVEAGAAFDGRVRRRDKAR